MSAGVHWLALPQGAARRVAEFFFDPMRYLDPGRAPAWVPAGCEGLSAAAQSGALRRCIDGTLPDPLDALDLHRPEHRVALLPAGGLARLALRLALLGEAPRLKRVVLARERQQLDTCLDAADWQFVYAQPGRLAPTEPQSPVEGWAERLLARGWAELEALCAILPQAIGGRLRLKLPPAHAAEAVPAGVLDRVRAVYAGAMADWNAQWEPDWQAALAAARRSE